MALIVKKGEINHLRETTTNIGRNGNLNTLHVWAFRIGDVPAGLKSSTHNSLSDGDSITAVGEIKKGSLVVYAFRNETTGAYDEAPVMASLVLGVLFIIIGIPLSFFIVGIVPLFYGIRIVYSAYLGNNAKTLLRNS